MRLLRSSDPAFNRELQQFCASAAVPAEMQNAVSGILAEVRARGDDAIAEFTRRFDKAQLTPAQFRVSADELKRAAAGLSKAERAAIRGAEASILAYNRRGLPKDWTARNPHGAKVGERFYPIRRVGLYIPGGQVPLVSTVLMTVTLARIAKCSEIAVFTPPGPGGAVNAALLGTLHLAGIKEVYRIGGVQAVGAMAFGTATIPAVDKIFGPGNAFTVEAKRQVFGTVGVDLLPGPSEAMVIADATAHPDYVAADLMAQAEHGSGREKIYFVTTSEKLVPLVEAELEQQLQTAGRADIIRRVLAGGALTVVVKSLDEAARVANYVAPEHLELEVAPKAAATLLKKITTAGAILLGHDSPTVLGDFAAGPSHTLPTGRTGRFFSGLRVADFLRRTSVVQYDQRSLRRAAPVVAAFSAMEQLDSHGRSLTRRFEKN